MIDFNFRDHLIVNRFARYNMLTYLDVEDAIKIRSRSMVPLLFHKNNDYIGCSKRDYIQIAYFTQFNDRVVNRDKIMEVASVAHYPARLKTTDGYFFVGKGFISIKDIDGTHKILMLMTIPGADYVENFVSDITLLVDPLYKTKSQAIKSVINNFITEHTGDTIFTNKIINYICTPIRLPSFNTIKERIQYVNKMIDDCMISL